MSIFGRRLQQGSGIQNRLYLDPADGSFNTGDTVAINIREFSGGNDVNAIQANLSYPASLLQFESISTSGSPFTSTVQSEGGSGSVKLGVGLMGGSVSGDQPVGRVTFTALASGTAAVDFASGSGIASSDTNTDICQATPGASFTIN